jgi:ArsR family transcriptional regulator, arsenate/arsenite/antimonite-responsive transcriptional repressor
MPVSKTEVFSTEEKELAEIAKALSHPARIKILKILTEYKVCFCGQIVDLLPLSQATVSQHLKELKRVGIISGEIDGPKTCYCINPELLQKSKNLFNKYLDVVCKC